MIDLNLFFDISRDVAMATDSGEKNDKLPTFVALAFRNGMGLRRVCARLNSTTNATISCKILAKIGPVVSAENRSIEIALQVQMVAWFRFATTCYYCHYIV